MKGGWVEIVVEGEWRCVDGFGEGGSVRFR